MGIVIHIINNYRPSPKERGFNILMISPISSTLEKSVKRQFEIFVCNTDSDSSEKQMIESNDYFIYVMHENVICFDEILINRVIDFEPIV